MDASDHTTQEENTSSDEPPEENSTSSTTPEKNETSSATPDEYETSNETPDEYEQLYERTIPSVVSIYVRPEDGRGGAGSGFVYDDAHVVTNQHVVGDAESVELRFGDGSWATGAVVGTDVYTDLAIVRAENLPDDVESLTVATRNPAPGQPVAALGNPMGLDGSITRGIVSGANRSTPTENGFAIPDTVQTDAAINPGNSGGPLVTTEGEVVGVNRARQGDGIGFAISPAIVRRVVPALIADGTFRHSYLKIRLLDVSPSVAAANDLDEPRGVLVVGVDLGPASAALYECTAEVVHEGRRIPVGGDVITGVHDNSIDTHEELMRYLILETQPGELVELDLIRDGRSITERVTLGERPRPGRTVVMN